MIARGEWKRRPCESEQTNHRSFSDIEASVNQSVVNADASRFDVAQTPTRSAERRTTEKDDRYLVGPRLADGVTNPQITQISADEDDQICVHLRNLRIVCRRGSKFSPQVGSRGNQAANVRR
jgi:hypothetical protein